MTAPARTILQHLAATAGFYRDLISEQGSVAAVRHGYRRALLRLHYRIADPLLGVRQSRATGQFLDLDSLTIDSANLAEAGRHEPTPRLLVRWIARILPRELASWSFVDIGAGSGRVVLEAARFPFRRVMGVEFSRELADLASENVRQFCEGRVATDTVTIVCVDATEVTLPDGPIIIYLFNTFGAGVLRQFLSRAMSTQAVRPRPMIFLYCNPLHRHVFDEFSVLTRIEYSGPQRLKFSLFSPFELECYATPEVSWQGDRLSVQRPGRNSPQPGDADPD